MSIDMTFATMFEAFVSNLKWNEVWVVQLSFLRKMMK